MSRSEERRARTEVRRKLAEARKVLKELNAARSAALRQIARDCKGARRDVRARVKAWKSHQAEIMKAAIYGARAQMRNTCEARKRQALDESRTAVDGVRAAIAIEKRHLEELKRAAAPANPRRKMGGVRAEQKRREALDEIAANLPAEYIEVWEAFREAPDVQKAIRRAAKPGARLSATEAVLEYFEHNPQITYDLQRKIEADAIKDWEAHERELKRLAKKKRVSLDEVPF